MSVPLSLATLNELFDYNYWARDLQLRACAALTQEQFLRPVGGSFPSVRDTLAHLVNVEWLWLERFRGRSPRSLPAAAELPTLDAVSGRWSAVEREMREYLGGLNEEALERVETYVSTRGQTWRYALWRMIVHLLNHQSYHRGQITNLLRQLGVPPPPVDFLNALDAGFRS
jgi:uncharacterized damage-inducible protein DinB